MPPTRPLAAALQSLQQLGDPKAVAEVLGALHRQGGPDKALRTALPLLGKEALGAREDRLRAEARLTDRVIDEVLARRPTPSAALAQQELLLQGPLGGSAAGRFVVENARPAAATVTFRCSEAVGPDGLALWLPLRLSPARPTLAPGAEQIVELRVALTDEALRPGQRLDLDVDVLIAGSPALRLAIGLRVLAPL